MLGGKTLSDVPIDQIRDAMTRTPEVIVTVKRQNARGQWGSVASAMRKPTAELAALDDWLMSHGGGGKYRISATDPADPTSEVVPAFIVEIEGQPRPATFMQEAMAPGAVPPEYHSAPQSAPGYGGAYPPAPAPPRPYGFIPPWAAGLPPSQQAAFLPPQQPQQGFDPGQRYNQPLNRYTPDELAKQTSDRLEKELGEVRKTLETVRQTYEAKIDTLNAQLLEAKTTAREREFEARIQAMIAQNAAQHAQAAKPQTDMFDKIVALTPLFQLWMTGNQNREGLAVNQQTRMLELMMAKKDDSGGTLAMIEKFAPLAVPLITKLFDARGPEAQAKLIEQMSEQQLTFLGMAAQLVQSQIEAEAEAEGAKGKLIPVLEQVLGGAMQLGQAWLQGKQYDDLEQLPPELRMQKLKAMGVDDQSIMAINNEIMLKQQAQAQRALPMQQAITSMVQRPPQPQPQAQPPAVTQVRPIAPPVQPDVVHAAEVVTEEPALSADENERIRRADALVQQQLKNPLVPPEFKTPEWARLLVLIHAQLDPDGVAEELATYLDHLADEDKLPQALSGFHDNPRATLARIFALLPIQKSAPQYVKALLDEIDKLYEPEEQPAPASNGGAQQAQPAVPIPNLEPFTIEQH
jgi:hypothetical protein